ncbi:Aldose 1-epimerase precursor [Roseimaritima multifibrata]|uniref:Aldose 1-epimerase n=1 Tax=Roseimaritima multifibrata TaxID=1930274 RepID=A0A517MG55_9BACT|nr:aldose epimerase family protein [Roseimaritima multifibrata]QDS93862.1 Aldose 1-epimerase precursor [Roseimaritima multifibrata]
MLRTRLWGVLLLCFLGSVVPANLLAKDTTVKIESSAWGKTSDGTPVTRYVLTNSHGNSVGLTDWGATLLEVIVPDRDGKKANVNLSFDSLDGYLGSHPHFGGTIGRFANRIAKGHFEIDGKSYSLVINNGPNHLHGGNTSYDHRMWSCETFEEAAGAGVRFTLVDPDGYEGYPGNLTVVTEYRWNDANELTIQFTATTDAATHVNLTNHSYWNLAGAGSGSAMGHVAAIEADELLDVDETLIPTGTFNSVEGTVFDFRKPTAFGDRVDQLPATSGYDHCYVVRGTVGELRAAARVVEPKTGRVLEIETTQPGMQLYTANHLPGNDSSAGAGGHEAFCLETQGYPDAPNKPTFPTTLLKPGETLKETTIHRFSVDN